MGIWYTLLIVLHIIICFFLVLLILVQNDKGGGLAGAFGGMGSNAAFSGSSAATFLTTLTGWAAIGSLVVIILLNVMAGNNAQNVRSESELKSANKGLSSAIPGNPGYELPGQAPSTGAVPGLGAPPSNDKGSENADSK